MQPALPLLTAFAVERGSVLALAGGGGKTSLMYTLARALSGRGWRVLTTTTTRIYPPGPSESAALVLLDGEADALGLLRRRLAEAGHVTVAQRRKPDGKLAGVPGALVDDWATAGIADAIIVEADGSAGRPLKAAREGEPVFPRSTTDCVLVMGIEALGMPLEETHVFRSALAAEITSLRPGAPVTPEAAALLLLGPRGLARSASVTTRLTVFLNKVEDPEGEARAQALARAILDHRDPRLGRIVMGSLKHTDAGFAVWERA